MPESVWAMKESGKKNAEKNNNIVETCINFLTAFIPQIYLMQSDFSPNYSIEYSNPLRTKSTHLKSGNTIITDAPTDNHGRGEAFSPTDLLSSSLVSCIMTIIGIAAHRDGIEIISMEADVTKEMASNPRMVAVVRALINVGFTRLGIAKSFIHVDSDSKPDAIWLY